MKCSRNVIEMHPKCGFHPNENEIHNKFTRLLGARKQGKEREQEGRKDRSNKEFYSTSSILLLLICHEIRVTVGHCLCHPSFLPAFVLLLLLLVIIIIIINSSPSSTIHTLLAVITRQSQSIHRERNTFQSEKEETKGFGGLRETAHSRLVKRDRCTLSLRCLLPRPHFLFPQFDRTFLMWRMDAC